MSTKYIIYYGMGRLVQKMINIHKSMIILLAIIFKFLVIESVINAYGKPFYIFR